MKEGIAGAGVKVFLAGKEIGWATGLNGQISIQTEDVNILGQIDTAEIKPVRRSATVTVNFVRIRDEDLKKTGLWKTGDTLSFLQETPLDLLVMDEIGEKAVYTLQGCVAQNLDFSVDSQSLIKENVSFKVRRVLYEGEL